MVDEVKKQEPLNVRVVRLEERMNYLNGEVSEMKTWMKRIDEKLSDIVNANPIGDFLKKNWHFIVGVVALFITGNSALLLELLKQYMSTQM